MIVPNRAKKLVRAVSAALMVCAGAGNATAAQVTGAIFTTLVDGSAVDYNIYSDKEAVYINGGPNSPKAPCTAAGLPDGSYYFQVTDPSGKMLLSTDSLTERKVLVQGGIIKAYLGSTHGTGIGKCGSVTVQLYPFNDTPNPGGEYKVWMQSTKDFKDFLPSKSKTDNFKAPGDIDSDGDGLTDAVEIALGTNPVNPDTDGDGLSDGQEVNDYETNPLSPDSDGDGLPDYDEVMIHHTNPTVADSDNDSFTDFEELMIFGTNPLVQDADTNGNHVPDVLEVCPDGFFYDPTTNTCVELIPG